MSTSAAQQLERLLELTRGLNAPHQGDSYLQSILSAAMELTGSETASILEYDGESGYLRFGVLPPAQREILAPLRIPVDSSAAGWVVRNGAPLVISDADQDQRLFRQADASSGLRTRSLLAVPLKYRDKVVGVFEALNKANNAAYTQDDISILETLAVLACSVLQNDLLERRVKISLDEMVQLDRLKSDFIAVTSHELRTPLGLILGHATFLHEMLDAQYFEQVDTIIRNAARLKEIIDNLSSVDNYQSGVARLRQGRVSLRRIAEEVTASFEQLAQQKHIQLKLEPAADELLIEADGNKIAIALSNLVKNALTFTRENGHVSVSTDAMPGFAQVSVADDGIGIPAADLPRIFDRFFQVESHLTRRFGGMGLGLSVARAMVELHGGRIWAESVEGKGSCFTFLLPFDHHPANPAVRAFSQ